MPRLVILGSGTGVGKTWVTESLAIALGAALPAQGVVALKPVETGLELAGGDLPESSDAFRLARASRGLVRAPIPHFYSADPVSPHLAARRAGVTLEPAALRQWADSTCETLAIPGTTLHWVLVETAGGVFSPLSERHTNFDLACAFEPAIWVLVAADALGVLHDVTATLAAMAARGRSPDFLVLSESRARDSSTGSNAAELARLGIAQPIATLAANDRSGIGPLLRALTDAS